MPKVNIKTAKTAGFCFGVSRAVSEAERLSRGENSVATLGELIHNADVIASLAEKGVRVVNSVSEVKKDDTLIIRSHGVGRAVYEEIEAAGINFIDATCPFVKKIHDIVSEYSCKGYDIIIAGDENHPEVKGIIGHSFSSVYVISGASDLENLCKSENCFSNNKQILVAQTTFDLLKWRECVEIVKKHCTNTKFFDTICSATTNRQEEALALSCECGIVVIVGGKNSSNSRKLFDICKNRCKAYFVENANELKKDALSEIVRTVNILPPNAEFNIGITAGASTPADIIKEVHSIMSEAIKNDDTADIDFMAEVDKTFKRVYIGNRVKAYVVAVHPTEAVVDIGTKHSGYIPADELTSDPSLSPKDVVKVGDTIDCIVTSLNDAEGVVYLSKKKVDAAVSVEKISAAKDDNSTLEGVVTNVVKGGVIVSCDGARVFIPASQTGVPRNGKLEDLLRKTVPFKVIEVNEARGRVVGSIRAASKEVNDAAKAKFWSEIEVGKKYTGEVKSMESYGVFVDLGGVDGMVHASELTWNRIKHPKEVVSIGDKLDVYVKAFDPEKKRVSLGAKDPNDNPWTKFTNEFAVGDVIKVQVVSITAFGAFAQIIPGVDGLIHISQIANERITNVNQILSVGQVVEAKITEIENEKMRVSLSMKALLEPATADAEEVPDEKTEE